MFILWVRASEEGARKEGGGRKSNFVSTFHDSFTRHTLSENVWIGKVQRLLQRFFLKTSQILKLTFVLWWTSARLLSQMGEYGYATGRAMVPMAPLVPTQLLSNFRIPRHAISTTRSWMSTTNVWLQTVSEKTAFPFTGFTLHAVPELMKKTKLVDAAWFSKHQRAQPARAFWWCLCFFFFLLFSFLLRMSRRSKRHNKHRGRYLILL